MSFAPRFVGARAQWHAKTMVLMNIKSIVRIKVVKPNRKDEFSSDAK